MIEGGRPVVLDEKMRDPSQRVRNDERSGDPPPVPQRDRREQQRPTGERAHKMNRPRPLPAVRAHVFRPEIFEIGFRAHAAEITTLREFRRDAC